MAKGENIYKRKDGRWEARFIKGHDENRKICYGFCYGRTYHEAKEKAFIARIAWIESLKDSDEKAKKQQFGAFCDYWLMIHKERWKPTTIQKYQTMLYKHIKPYLGKYSMEQITIELISRFSQELLHEKMLSVKSARDVLTLLHQILAFNSITSEFLANSMIYPKQEPKPFRVLTEKEYQRLIAYLMQDMDIYKFCTFLSLQTGLRIGEVCALRWENISTASGVLKVYYTIQRIKNPSPTDTSPKTILHLGSPKTRRSIREIPLTNTLTQLCSKFQTDAPQAFLLTGNLTLPEPRKLQRKLCQYAKELQIPDIHFHTLRHTFATRCVEAGCDVKTLSELLGHSSISMTMNRYVHPSIDWKRHNIQKLEQAGFGENTR